MIPRYLIVILAFLLMDSSGQKSMFTLGGAPLDLSNIKPTSGVQVNPHFPSSQEINNMLRAAQPQQQQPAQQQQTQAASTPQVTQEQIQMMVLQKLVEDQGKQLQAAQQQTQMATQQMESFKLQNEQLKHDLQLVNGQNAQLQLHINQLEANVQELQQNLENGQRQLEEAWQGSHQLEAYNNQLLGQVNQLQENKAGLELEIERLREMELVERDLRLQLQQAHMDKERKNKAPAHSTEQISSLLARLEELKKRLDETKVEVKKPEAVAKKPEPVPVPAAEAIERKKLDQIEKDLAELYKKHHGKNTTVQERPERHRLNIINYL